MSQNLAAFLYLIASVCFIMSLRGLSSPATSQGGQRFGIIAVAISIGTTQALPSAAYSTVADTIFLLAIGGAFAALVISAPSLGIDLPSQRHFAMLFVGGAGVQVAMAVGEIATWSFFISESGEIQTASMTEIGIKFAGAIAQIVIGFQLLYYFLLRPMLEKNALEKKEGK